MKVLQKVIGVVLVLVASSIQPALADQLSDSTSCSGAKIVLQAPLTGSESNIGASILMNARAALYSWIRTNNPNLQHPCIEPIDDQDDTIGAQMASYSPSKDPSVIAAVVATTREAVVTLGVYAKAGIPVISPASNVSDLDSNPKYKGVGDFYSTGLSSSEYDNDVIRFLTSVYVTSSNPHPKIAIFADNTEGLSHPYSFLTADAENYKGPINFKTFDMSSGVPTDPSTDSYDNDLAKSWGANAIIYDAAEVNPQGLMALRSGIPQSVGMNNLIFTSTIDEKALEASFTGATYLADEVPASLVNPAEVAALRDANGGLEDSPYLSSETVNAFDAILQGYGAGAKTAAQLQTYLAAGHPIRDVEDGSFTFNADGKMSNRGLTPIQFNNSTYTRIAGPNLPFFMDPIINAPTSSPSIAPTIDPAPSPSLSASSDPALATVRNSEKIVVINLQAEIFKALKSFGSNKKLSSLSAQLSNLPIDTNPLDAEGALLTIHNQIVSTLVHLYPANKYVLCVNNKNHAGILLDFIYPKKTLCPSGWMVG
jgi:hypothetical protein